MSRPIYVQHESRSRRQTPRPPYLRIASVCTPKEVKVGLCLRLTTTHTKAMAGKGAFRHLLSVLFFISLTQGQTPYVKEPDKNGTTIVSDNRPSSTGLGIKGANITVSPLENVTKITSDDEFTGECVCIHVHVC